MDKRKFAAIAIAIGVMFAALAGTSVGATVTVSIVDFDYVPPAVTVAPGTDVTWTNTGEQPHTVTRCPVVPGSTIATGRDCPGAGTGADPITFDSGNLNPTQVFTQRFNGPGTYIYFCKIHGYALMHGTVTVDATVTTTPPSTTPPTTTPPTTTPPTTIPATTTPPTTTPPTTTPGSQCAQLRQTRTNVNAQIDAAEASVVRQFTGSQRDALVAQLEANRAQSNAAIDQQLQASGCQPGV